ncbi:hypothetical protein [Paludibacterium paludis]|nr:hypothetical protein [Paludibacterium paludis]
MRLPREGSCAWREWTALVAKLRWEGVMNLLVRASDRNVELPARQGLVATLVNDYEGAFGRVAGCLDKKASAFAQRGVREDIVLGERLFFLLAASSLDRARNASSAADLGAAWHAILSAQIGSTEADCRATEARLLAGGDSVALAKALVALVRAQLDGLTLGQRQLTELDEAGLSDEARRAIDRSLQAVRAGLATKVRSTLNGFIALREARGAPLPVQDRFAIRALLPRLAV